MSRTSAHDAPHYPWGEQCDGWRLLDDDDLSVTEERMPPGAAETRHRHARAGQFFYMLDGSATLELDGIAHQLQTGEGMHVPPGTAHWVRNNGDTDARFLVISAPRSQGDRGEARA